MSRFKLMNLGLIHIVTPFKYISKVTSFITLLKKIFSILIIFISLTCTNSIFAADVKGSFSVPMSAGDPKEDPTKDRVEALYNQIGVGGGGVNLFTGDASLSIPIDILNLNYSGNVYKILASPNERIQSSWVGTGWTLTMGYISAVQNNTVELGDDTYYIVTEDGVSGELKQIGISDEFCLEDYKYWKIQRILEGNKITHWLVTKEDGTVYKYGDGKTNSTTVYEGNRYALAWGNWIGNGTASGSEQVPYQWDLTKITNTFGVDVLTIEYQHPDNPTFENTGLQYTRSSYLERITQRSGRKIEFELEARAESEWVDPYPEYDNLLERYETRRLGSINIQSPDGEIISKYNFLYLPGPAEGGPEGEGRGKQFLMEISQMDKDGHSLPSHKFEYACLNKSDNEGNYEVNGDLAYKGSLTKITYPSGGSTKFEYDCTDNTDQINSMNMNSLADQFMVELGAPNVYFTNEHLVILNTYPGPDDLSISELMAWHWDGKSWAPQVDPIDPNGLDLWGYDPESLILGILGCWINDNGEVTRYTSFTPVLKGYKDNFALITIPNKSDLNNAILWAWHWSGNKWIRQCVDDNIIINCALDVAEPIIMMTQNKMVIFENYDVGVGQLKTYVWDDSKWIKANSSPIKVTPDFKWGGGIFNNQPVVALDGNHLIVLDLQYPENWGSWRLKSWFWDDQDHEWIEEANSGLDTFVAGENLPPQMYLDDNKLVILSGENLSKNATLFAWMWTGNEWEKITILGDITVSMFDSHVSQLRVVDDKIVILDDKNGTYQEEDIFGTSCYLYAWHWDGKQYVNDTVDNNLVCSWSDEYNPTNSITIKPQMTVLKDKIIIFQPEFIGSYNGYTDVKYYRASLRSWHYNENDINIVADNNWDAYKGDSFIDRDFHWVQNPDVVPQLSVTSDGTSDIILTLSQGIREPVSNYSHHPFTDLRAYRWNGMQWDTNIRLNKNWGERPIIFSSGDHFIISKGSIGGDVVLDPMPFDTVFAFADYNDTWGGVGDLIKDYYISGKITNDGMGNTTITGINYKNGVYDLNSGTVQYNEAIVTMPDKNGSIETYFYNDLGPTEAIYFQAVESDLSGDEEHYKKLDGKPYKIVNKNNGGTEVSSMINTYSLHDIDAGNNIFHPRLVETVSTMDEITTTESYQYNNENGMVKTKTETNTDETKRITHTTYAFEKYTDMNLLNKHMLSQVAQQTVFYNMIFPTTALSSTVNTYKEWPTSGSGNWAPDKVYVWREDDAYKTLDGFDEWVETDSELEPDAEWVKGGEVIERDQFGNMLEYTDANGTSTSVKWGFNGTLPVASIANAKLSEFACEDYETDNPLFYKSSASNQEVVDNFAFSGKKSLKVLSYPEQSPYDYAISYTIYSEDIDNMSDTYIFSAWVFADQIDSRLEVGIKYKDTTGEHYPPVVSYDETRLGEWQLLETKFDLNTVGAGLEWIQAITRNIGENEYPCYWDDLRFYPSDALMTTQTYDPATLSVSSVSNENNIPSFTDYDGFNRPMSTSNSEYGTLNYSSYYYSREDNEDSQGNDVFNKTAPNFVENISFPFGNFAPNWSFEQLDDQGHPLDWEGYYSGNISVVGNRDELYLSPKFGTNALKVNDTDAHDKTDGAQFNFYNIKDNEYSQLVGQVVSFSAYVKTFGESKQIKIGIENNDESNQFYTISSDWKKIEIKVSSLKSQKGSYLRCFIVSAPGATGTFYIDGVVLEKGPGSFPMVTRTYYDGLGREIQSQTWDGDAELVNLSQYNSIGKVSKIYKAQRYKNSTFPHLFADISTNNNLYESFIYENSPLSRIANQIHADGHLISYGYDKETNNNTNYRFEQVTDEEGKISKSYFDKFGNNVGGIGGYTNTSNSDKIEWSQKYDILGNMTDNEPPNAFDPGPVENWSSKYTYNTLGQMISRETPDEGITNFIYDPKGNVICSQNAYQSGHGKFTVNYYDAHDRLVLTGEENNVWPPDLTQYYNQGYLTGGNEWKIRYTYDKDQLSGDILTNYCRNKLSMVEVNADGSKDSDHIYKYVYDPFGNITEKYVWLNKGYKIHNERILYEYDALGRKIMIQYPSGRTLYHNYDNAGRLKNIVSLADLKQVIQLDVKVFLEGPYNPNTSQMTTALLNANLIPLASPYSEDMKTLERIPEVMTDWVLVELLTQPSGSVVDSRSAILLKDGTITAEDGVSPLQLFATNGDLLYIRIRHRNHMAVISATPIEVQSNNVAHYDFTQNANQYYNQYGMIKLQTGQYAMLAGDTDQSLSIGASDRAAAQRNIIEAGYNSADCNLDGQIDQLDQELTLENSQKSIPVE